jgi:hypothetical protein
MRIAGAINNAAVTCFHYVGNLPNPELSQEQMEALIVQLHAHKANHPIPFDFNASHLKYALKEFGVTELNADTVYGAIRKVAILDLHPFGR